MEKGEMPLKADKAYGIAERWGVSMDYLYRGRLSDMPPKLVESLIKTFDQPNE
jgi:hypothetical protein